MHGARSACGQEDVQLSGVPGPTHWESHPLSNSARASASGLPARSQPGGEVVWAFTRHGALNSPAALQAKSWQQAPGKDGRRQQAPASGCSRQGQQAAASRTALCSHQAADVLPRRHHQVKPPARVRRTGAKQAGPRAAQQREAPCCTSGTGMPCAEAPQGSSTLKAQGTAGCSCTNGQLSASTNKQPMPAASKPLPPAQDGGALLARPLPPLLELDLSGGNGLPRLRAAAVGHPRNRLAGGRVQHLLGLASAAAFTRSRAGSEAGRVAREAWALSFSTRGGGGEVGPTSMVWPLCESIQRPPTYDWCLSRSGSLSWALRSECRLAKALVAVAKPLATWDRSPAPSEGR